MKIRLLIILLTLTLVPTLAPVTAFAQGEGIIRGIIENGTREGSSVAGQTVHLVEYLNEVESKTQETVSGDDGSFSFEGLNTGADHSYQLKAVFREVEYSTDPEMFDSENNTQSIKLKVYDTTENPESISVITSHVIVRVEGERLLVDEYYLFGNDLDYTYIGQPSTFEGEEREVLRFTLPSDFSDFSYSGGQTGDSVVPTDDGFASTAAVLPGMQEVAFSYSVDYSEGEYELNRKLYYPAAGIDLMVKGEGLDVSASGFTTGEPFEVEGSYYQHFTSSDLESGQILAVTFSGKPSSGSRTTIVWIVVLVIAVIGVSAVLYYRRNRNIPIESSPGNNDEIDILLNRLASLDDDFEDGIINENEYNNLRSSLKSQLAELMSHQNEE